MKYIKLFEFYNAPEVLPIENEDIEFILNFTSEIFSKITNITFEGCKNYTNSFTDWDKSVKLLLNGSIIGCYLISDKEIEELQNKKGIEGIALCVLPKFRGRGYGELLKNWLEKYAKEHNYDYIFGQHLKSLNNIKYWLKRREIWSEDDESFYTIKWL